MSERVLLDPTWSTHPLASTLSDYQRVENTIRSHSGFMARSTAKCYRIPLDGVPVFIKYYQFVREKEGLRLSHFRLSRPMREWRNLHFFRNLDIATTPPVAVGERRRFGMFRSGFIVTREIERAEELGVLAARHPEHVADAAFFNPLCGILADAVRRMHRKSFFHNDLNGRNVLIRETNGLEVFLFDSPNGRRWFFPFREYRLIKDLASLDGSVRHALRRTQRLRFYLAYVARKRLTNADKRRIDRVVARSAAPQKPLDPDVRSYI